MEFQAEYILLNFGNQEVQIRYYGIIIVSAMLIAAYIASRLAERAGRDSDHIWGALTWAIFPGIVFARLWFVLFPPVSLTAGCSPDAIVGPSTVCYDTAWFFQNFFNLENGAIAVWSGGLHIFGAVIGGLLGVWLYFGPLHNRVALFFHYIFLPVAIIFEAVAWVFVALFQKIGGRDVTPFQIPRFETTFPSEGMKVSPWLDFAGIVLPLAQGIGRWANYINQELYGTPTDLPWGIAIDPGKRVPPYTAAQYDGNFHPLFLYESLWNLIAFVVLFNLYNRFRDRFRAGDFFLLYLAQYAFIRFFLEFLRIEIAYFPGTEINSAQVISAVVFVLAVVAFFVRRNNNPYDTYEASTGETSPEAA
ncbi:MAG: prolipoprotein diacylglyceryl transferase [Anaerolineae bacterium]